MLDAVLLAAVEFLGLSACAFMIFRVVQHLLTGPSLSTRAGQVLLGDPAQEESLRRKVALVLGPQAYTGEVMEESAERLRSLLRADLMPPDACVRDLCLFFSAHRAMSATCEWALNIRATVHYNLFLGTIHALGTPEQVAAMAEATRRGELGCFCLTEKGAGVLSGMIVNTTASWDRDHFDLHTPDENAEKVWISQGLVALWGVVIARLLVDGKDLGPHAFLVDMRQRGVIATNMAPKTAFNGLDNAMVAFKHVRLAADALLGRYSQMREGRYTLTGAEPFRFVQLAQRLLSGRLCIAVASLSALQGMQQEAEAHMRTRRVATGPQSTAPLAELPYVQDALQALRQVAWVHRAFADLCERDFARAIEGGGAVGEALVDRIAAAKIESVEFATVAGLRLRQLVGAYGLMAASPFGRSDIFFCMRFAEGDTRVLQQKMARDLLRGVARLPNLLLLALQCTYHGLQRLLGLAAPSAVLRLRRDVLLLQLALRLMRVPKERLPAAWLQLGVLPYRLAHRHAAWLMHAAVADVFGESTETQAFFRANCRDEE